MATIRTGKVTSIYLSQEILNMLEELRRIIIEVDRLKYGDDYVEEELAKRNKSKYGKNRIMEEAIEKGVRELIAKYSKELEELQQKRRKRKEKKDNTDPLARIIFDVVNPANDYVWERM